MIESYSPFQPTLTDAGLKRFGLILKHSPTSKILRGIVHSYLQITATKPTPYPMIPDGTQAIFISPHGSRIGGAQTKACDIPILQPGEYFGIRFFPGALRYFFHLDLSEITDQFADSRYFPCRYFGDLHNDIYRRQDFYDRVRICEQWLLRHFDRQAANAFDNALYLVYQSAGNIRVGNLANEVGWSSRHINRQFRFHTGLSTKTFVQTIRIQHACKILCESPRSTLNTAHALGFFDQSHLINDYKKRLLSNPSSFFNRFMSDFYNR